PYLSLYHSSRCSVPQRYLPPFPTRRSSDLMLWDARIAQLKGDPGRALAMIAAAMELAQDDIVLPFFAMQREFASLHRKERQDDRSEEHTSELQSRVDLVCRLLLEKKKKQRL